MLKNSVRVLAALLFTAFAAYSAFAPAHAGSGAPPHGLGDLPPGALNSLPPGVLPPGMEPPPGQ